MPFPIRQLKQGEFPPALLEIPQPPAELYLQGELPNVKDHLFLTVVGSRKVSSYGREAAEKIIAGLASYPIIIVSGLAIGVDAIAHRAALKAGLKTVAFPGSGLDRRALYPAVNKRLADEIVERGGALISEFPPDMKATLYTFPQRNRLMAGISKATLIVEAGEKSGTLITARLALDYNRDVLAIPGSIFASGSFGTNRLIRQGATPVTRSEDVLEALGFEIEETSPDKQQRLFAELSPVEQKVVATISLEPLPRDELIVILGLPTAEANALLGLMEIKGVIKETQGEIRLV